MTLDGYSHCLRKASKAFNTVDAFAVNTRSTFNALNTFNKYNILSREQQLREDAHGSSRSFSKALLVGIKHERYSAPVILRYMTL